MRPLVLVVTLTLGLSSSAQAKDTCASIRAGATVFSRPAKEANAGLATGQVTGFIEKRGAWYRLRVEDLHGDKNRTSSGSVTIYAPKKSVSDARCPAPVNAYELGLASTRLALRWKDGAKAGWVDASAAVAAAGRSSERVELEGEKHACFDHAIVDGLVVHVCGKCATLVEAAKRTLLVGSKPCLD